MSLPISLSAAKKGAQWIAATFEQEINAAINGSPFSLSDIIAIALQETGYIWTVPDVKGSAWIDKYPKEVILGRMVLDASGDILHDRSAFPKDANDFISRYGADFAGQLTAEANLTRAMRSLHAASYVYDGYGIFQFDLQNILPAPNGYDDRQFFEYRLWYVFEECLKRLMRELQRKYSLTKDVDAAIKAYNGSGKAAEEYLANVQQFRQLIA